MTKSLIRYLGGKGLITSRLIEYIPEHRYYAEVFGGAGNMLFAKKPAHDVYNDINSDVVNLFRVLRDKEKFEELKRLLSLTPVSTEEYYTLRARMHEGSDVERAYCYYYVMKNCFGGRQTNPTFGYSITESGAYGLARCVTDYLSGVNGLEFFARRLMTVTIENLDYKELFDRYISRWNYDNAFVYLDPPYYPEARKVKNSRMYIHDMTAEQHEELMDVIDKYSNNAKYMIHGYDNELYKRRLVDKGWQKIGIETICSLCGRVKGSKYFGDGVLKQNQKRIDCIWINYTITGGLYGENM